jgi:predicted Zn-dependent protease with MMP-like domain
MPALEVSPRRFRSLVEQALDQLPDEWQEMLGQVVVLIEDLPSPEDLEFVGMRPDEATDLLGLYVGVPLTERSAFDEGLPDRIMIYRDPILAICDNYGDVLREVQHTVLHELGHHFGLLEDDLPF